MIDNKIPPNNIDAEKSVLGCMMIEEEAIEKAIEILVPDDFYNPNHKEIFRCIKEIFKSNGPVDAITIKDRLQEKNLLTKIGGVDYLTLLIDIVPTATRIEHYAKIVEEKSTLRQIIKNSRDNIKSVYNSENEIDSMIDDIIYRFSKLKDDRKVNIDFSNDAFKNNFDDIVKDIEGGNKNDYIQTGWDTIDIGIGGLQKPLYHIVAARPSVGKSAFAVSLILNASKNNEDLTTVFFALEMTKKQLIKRMIANYFFIDANNFIDGINKNDKVALENKKDEFKKILSRLVIFDEKRYSTSEMKQRLDSVRKKYGKIDLIVVDHAQLIKADKKNQNRNLEVQEISGEFIEMRKDFNAHIIVLSQLSRAVNNRSTQRPILSDLRDSGALEQDADMVTFLHRIKANKNNDDFDPFQDNKCEVRIAKNRDGATGAFYFNFDVQHQKFSEYTNYKNGGVIE